MTANACAISIRAPPTLLADPGRSGHRPNLSRLNPGQAVEVLEEFPADRRQRIAAADSAGEQWPRDQGRWKAVGRLMEKPLAVFPAHHAHPRRGGSPARHGAADAGDLPLGSGRGHRLAGVVAFRELRCMPTTGRRSPT